MTLCKRIAVVVLALAIAALAEHKSASLQFLVVKDSTGKPVRNAEIVLHPVDKHGHQKAEGLELKTHEDGKAAVTGIPYGKMRVQVIAPGFKTYGEDFDINQPNHEFTIKLQKPSEQYSIYK
ncbi:MAG TPA: carboxypeptidase-like regulatory domain-containing protein [Candidatus Angelobacter sp.]|nr:carboxypeptidase-like regulatory domain-containing protein [Candidatus Angelobacter sp.]